MRFALFLLVAGSLSTSVLAQDEIPLRPNEPPAEDAFFEHGQPGGPRDRWLTKVGRASLIFYPAAKEKATGAAVIVCPGGGYQNLVIDAEGHDVARWLSSIGVAAFVLKYRLPLPQGAPNTVPGETKAVIEMIRPAVEDARLALKIAHDDASRWSVKPEWIGMMGFSAGGHLVAIVGNEPGPARPSFLALIYPAVPTDLELTADSPKAFLVVADNDKLAVPERGVLRYYQFARKAGVRTEMHVFVAGSHGFGIRKTRNTSSAFPELFENWLRQVMTLR